MGRVQELEEEVESAKQAWLKKQRSARDKSRGAQSKEVQALNRQLQAALQVRLVRQCPALAKVSRSKRVGGRLSGCSTVLDYQWV